MQKRQRFKRLAIPCVGGSASSLPHFCTAPEAGIATGLNGEQFTKAESGRSD
jgi:hypothetical protein